MQRALVLAATLILGACDLAGPDDRIYAVALVEGTVRTSTGAPAAGMEIRILCGSEGGEFGTGTQTDMEGRYSKPIHLGKDEEELYLRQTDVLPCRVRVSPLNDLRAPGVSSERVPVRFYRGGFADPVVIDVQLP